MELHENTLDRLVTVLSDRIDGIIENNIEILSQPGVSDYYRELLNKDTCQCKSDLMLLSTAYDNCDMETLSGLSKTYLKESERLQEADKSRFIKKFWSDAGCDAIDCRAHNRYELEQMIDFFNKYQNVKVDWQSKDTNILTLWNVMDAYYNSQAEKGGKDNAAALFKDTEKFRIMYENKDWLFVAPLVYEAAVDMDSYKIGGQGAKWCIGTKGDPSYWERYVVREGSAFVMAYRKTLWASPTEQKYMFQIQEGDLTVWPQDDNPNDTFGSDRAEKIFGVDWKTVKSWWLELHTEILSKVVPTVEEFDLTKVMNRKQYYNLSKATEYGTIHMKSFETDNGFASVWLKTQVVGIDKVNELYYSAKEYPMRSPDSEQILLFPTFRCIVGNEKHRHLEITKPKICLADLDMIGIGKFFIGTEDRGLKVWFKTKKLMINKLYIPQDSNTAEIHEMIENGASAVDAFKRYAKLSGAIDLSDVGEITVNDLYFNSSDYGRVPDEIFSRDEYGRMILDLQASYQAWQDSIDAEGNLDVRHLVETNYGIPDVVKGLIVYNLPRGIEAYWKSDEHDDVNLNPRVFKEIGRAHV